ncbi:MAG: glycosyltransferase [Symplocastrum torsivum CPER-KK1]|jgi:glycosyltransferase involved in cell wall biosynthesis|uniref:Glycosyltransferase n=1 Tax=Symplocastrum torsivum CPER-KK1 TaxID=450513 RepID=A0A951PGM1_9CYAN|nr:glycosyltransferase [Symplocastrum torsivum CPER-KK1]
MPLISVIIPVYNGEKTIQETIESVLNQTFTDFELIVINDGSQDATLEIVERIQEPRLKAFSYANAGQATSRNRGISHACGEYISFIDADDLWTPDKLEAQLRALQDNSQAAVAYSWTKCIDELGNFSRRGSHISVSGDVYAKLLLIDFIENGSNPLIRAQAIAEVGGFDESMTPSEDRDLWLRLAARYHFVAVPSPQVLYRQSPNSASANILRMEAASLRVIEQAFSQAPEFLQYLKQSSLANIYKGLTFKALEEPLERQRGLTAARLLWNSIKNDPALLRSRVILKVLFKIAVVTLLPPQQAQALLAKAKGLANTTTLLGYLQLDVS